MKDFKIHMSSGSFSRNRRARRADRKYREIEERTARELGVLAFRMWADGVGASPDMLDSDEGMIRFCELELDYAASAEQARTTARLLVVKFMETDAAAGRLSNPQMFTWAEKEAVSWVARLFLRMIDGAEAFVAAGHARKGADLID